MKIENCSYFNLNTANYFTFIKFVGPIQVCLMISPTLSQRKELPKWFVANCNSILSLDSLNGVAMIPALLLE